MTESVNRWCTFVTLHPHGIQPVNGDDASGVAVAERLCSDRDGKRFAMLISPAHELHENQ